MRAVGTAAEKPTTGGFVGFKHRLRDAARNVLAPLARGLARAGVRPDALTVLGCLLSLIAGLAFFEGSFRWASLALALSGLCDILDGQLARELGFESRFGAFLDSTLDRLGEGLVFTGIAGFYLVHLLELLHDPTLVLSEIERGLEPGAWARVSLTAMLALVGGFLVSYTRARAEGLGLECRVGWVERPERMVALIVAGSFGVSRVMPGVLLLLTVLSFITTAQRVVYVWKSARSGGEDPVGGGREVGGPNEETS